MKAKTIEERIEHFTIIHKGFYDYSLLSNPVKWDSRVQVICPNHGVFETIVNNHARGAGCPVCAGVKTMTREERIKQAKSIHGDKYDYSQWPEKVKASDKVWTKCLVDKTVWCHSIHNHINRKAGCPVCAKNTQRTFDDFILAAKTVHDGKYNYVFTLDVRNNSQITVECSRHGFFTQSVSNHLAGKGCSSCANHGFDPAKAGWFYVLKAEEMFKVGITNKFKQRMKQLKQSTPFSFTEHQKLYFQNGAEARKLERFYLMFYDSAGQKGFDGATEWLKGFPDLKITKGA